MNSIIREAVSKGRNLLEYESWNLMKEYGISVPTCLLAKDEKEAVSCAQEIGYPVVLKIVSKDIIHKSDVGGVKTNINNDVEVIKAYNDILSSVCKSNPNAEIDGILVCEMLGSGLETIIGMNTDVSFGPTVMFGLGGIFVELFNDVSLRVLPICLDEAEKMIKETKGYAILKGARGEQPKDIAALAELIVKVSKMVEENPEIKELDINPCFVYQDGVIPADARILL